jgi:hypothetical protein
MTRDRVVEFAALVLIAVVVAIFAYTKMLFWVNLLGVCEVSSWT